MTLIKSISGIRGTIGGLPGEGLTPLDLVKFTSAYAIWIRKQATKEKYRVIIGRDSRISGNMVNHLVCGTLMGMGIHVTDLGFASTPTVEMAVEMKNADGGIILTASHNPAQWNALKLLDSNGEFLSAEAGIELLDIAAGEEFDYASVSALGKYDTDADFNKKHIGAILDLPLVDVEAIRKSNFRVVIDCVNSVGGLIIPELLTALGVEHTVKLYCEPTGVFPHNPEPLPEHLTELSAAVTGNNADVGFATDPDVDRLAIVNEDGSMFGEEYTLVAVADHILMNTPGNTVSNLSSTKALGELTAEYGFSYTASAVGEVNVTTQMKLTGAVIGGEGNGGIIYPELHYGRDALVGIALFLTHLARSGKKCSELRKKYPDYYLSKNKIELSAGIDVDSVLNRIKNYYSDHEINEIDGLRIDFPEGWVHLRKSNTEPIIRIYSEGSDKATAENLALLIIEKIKSE
ncbi:MAG: phosphoglucosamine mutase [Bacteroidales bacterium]